MTISLVYYVRYIISWTNWWYYNFVQFEGGDLVENERNVAEYEWILASIDYSYTDDYSNNGYIITNSPKDIQDGNYVHPKINTRDDRLKIRELIKQAQSEWKG